MIRRLFAISLLLMLPALLTGCLAPAPGAQTVARAEKGDTKAMFRLAEFYCAREDEDSHGAETLKWWTKIAGGKNRLAAAQANEYLGLYHLSLFANEDTYSPDAPEPISYCTGSPAQPAYSKAVKYFTRCADSGLGPALSCQADLGHLYLHRRDYAKAYFWYATALGDASGKDDAEISPLDPDIATTLPAQNARRAAEHLTIEHAAAIARKAQEWRAARAARLAAKKKP